jgi:hypothetical protein
MRRWRAFEAGSREIRRPGILEIGARTALCRVEDGRIVDDSANLALLAILEQITHSPWRYLVDRRGLLRRIKTGYDGSAGSVAHAWRTGYRSVSRSSALSQATERRFAAGTGIPERERKLEPTLGFEPRTCCLRTRWA